MPIANPEVYREMMKRAKDGGFAYPAINVTSSQTLNAAIKGFAEAGSDGIVQASTGGAAFWSGSLKDMVIGAKAMVAFAHEVAAKYDVNIALHTDHCPKDKLATYMEPLVDISLDMVKQGKDPLFGSHMWDGSAVPLDENIEIAKRLFEKTAAANQILEIEIGVVGGEEDGVVGDDSDKSKLYTTPEDTWKVIEALGLSGERGSYTVAATFGNVHGVYKPGAVKLDPTVLQRCQAYAAERTNVGDKPFYFVFHGGSGSTKEEVEAAISYGVVKMNIDTDTQYAYTRPVVEHMFKNYDGVLKVDGEVGNKKKYDPRVWGAAAEGGMTKRVVEACQWLHADGTSMGRV